MLTNTAIHPQMDPLKTVTPHYTIAAWMVDKTTRPYKLQDYKAPSMVKYSAKKENK